MTDPVKEQLSACLDGELPEGELDLLLKQVGRDSQLRASLGRYALIGETLRAQRPVVAPADFSKRISASIAEEPAIGRRRVNLPAMRWLRPAAGVAVAAGVASVAILALQAPQEAETPTYVADAAQVRSDSPEAASYIVPANTDSTAFVPAARLTNYVVAHSEYSSPLGRRSVLSGVLAADEPGDDIAADDSMSDSGEPSSDVTQP
jgi:sigma-E factor negative regulatory protein RseA